jgi:hypothetical protein
MNKKIIHNNKNMIINQLNNQNCADIILAI